MKTMKTLKDVAGQTIYLDEMAAASQATEFLNRRFPAGWGKAEMRRAVKALERQARDVEIGALAREFA